MKLGEPFRGHSVDVSPDELMDAIESVIRIELENAKVTGPSVDALELAQSYYRIPVEYQEPEDEESRRYGQAPRRRARSDAIVLRFDQSDEAQAVLAARAIARQLVPRILKKLGVEHGTENRAAEKHLVQLIVPRILLPQRWFSRVARGTSYDLFELKAIFSVVSYEMIAWRMLDVDEDASIVAIVDDGIVAFRRGNRFSTDKKLTESESICLQSVATTKDPERVRRDDWTTCGWPISGIPFRRIVLRSVPDAI